MRTDVRSVLVTVRLRGKRNGQLTAGTLRIMLVPSIGQLFQAYAASINDVRDGVAILGGNCDCFIGKTKEALDAHRLVITFCGRGEADLKDVTHLFKDGEEFIVGIDMNHVAESYLKENILHKGDGEVCGKNGYKGDNNGESC